MIDIQKVADEKGIARTYFDATNKLVNISEESRKIALEILGYPVDDENALQEILKKEEITPYLNLLDPVLVLNDDDKKQVLVRTPEFLGEDENAIIKFFLQLEDGRLIQRTLPLEEVEIASFKEVQGKVYDTRRYFLTTELPHGYHTFYCQIESNGKIIESTKMSLIATPAKTYSPEPIAQGKKVWGISSQLYAVRSERNWGIGDFADLKKLLLGVSKCGGQFVGLNPMHAGYPAIPDDSNISPYSPSSRSWVNIIYISVLDVPELIDCKEARDYIKTDAFQKKLRALRDNQYVDYRGVTKLKLEVLHIIFDNVKVDDKRSKRGQKFLDFVENGGQELLNYATFNALQQSHYDEGVNAYSWQCFAKEYQDVNSPFVKQWQDEHKREILFYCYLQFLAQEQLADAYKSAKESGMLIGTYRDLAVGVAAHSCDVWADTSNIFRLKGSIGAPPDPLGPLGQSWGLSPMAPDALKNAGYKPMIQMYRANMLSCGAMRIDHAAGLFRLWITKIGEPASKGAYVHYDMHDLLSIISLESHRNKCMVITEDLGTIPTELTVALKKYGAYSYKIFFDERAPDGGFIAPKDYTPLAMAALTTHDMPTLLGWWSCADLDLGRKLGIYTEEERVNLSNQREEAKQRILDSLHGLHSISDSYTRNAKESVMGPELCKALQVHMCTSSCALFSSQVEDWIGVETPVNVPGTSSEYPNWKRKLTKNLEEIFVDEQVLSMTSEMTKARN